MKLFLQGEPTAVFSHVRSLVFGSITLMLLSNLTDGTGIITAVFAFGLGVSAVCLSDWRTELGLWMLATLLFLINAVTYVLIILGQLSDALRGVQAESIVLLVDAAIGTLLLSVTLRFLFRIAKENFLISYSQGED